MQTIYAIGTQGITDETFLKQHGVVARAYRTRSINRQLDGASARQKIQALMKDFDIMQASFWAMAKRKMEGQ